jgi:hypothetical protein
MKTCSICQNQFETIRKDTKYCSNKCKRTAEYQNRPILNKICINCGNNYQTQNKNSKFCSISCSNTYTKSHEDVLIICKECDKQFKEKYINRNKLFCSRSCATKNQNNKMFSDDKIKNKISETKKRQYLTGEIIHPFLGKTHTEETKKKLSKIKKEQGLWKGENNPAYGGQTNEVREKMSKTRAERIQSGEIKLSKGETVFFKKADKEVFARSSWEKKYMEYIDKDPNIISAIFEPFILPYTYDRKRNYIPDFLLVFSDGSKKLVEVKPSCFLEAKINKCKFEAAKEYCKQKNIIFEVWTEKSNPYK